MKPKGNMIDRQLAALGKLGKTKAGRKIIKECAPGIVQALCDGLGKP